MLAAERTARLRTARQALRLAFCHLNAARYLLLAHRLHMADS